jgi:hypothetical protein
MAECGCWAIVVGIGDHYNIYPIVTFLKPRQPYTPLVMFKRSSRIDSDFDSELPHLPFFITTPNAFFRLLLLVSLCDMLIHTIVHSFILLPDFLSHIHRCHCQLIIPR